MLLKGFFVATMSGFHMLLTMTGPSQAWNSRSAAVCVHGSACEAGTTTSHSSQRLQALEDKIMYDAKELSDASLFETQGQFSTDMADVETLTRQQTEDDKHDCQEQRRTAISVNIGIDESFIYILIARPKVLSIVCEHSLGLVQSTPLVGHGESGNGADTKRKVTCETCCVHAIR